jgi:uncharacterized membrane protein
MAAAHSDVTRLEAFSDAVFGFAITLLVVSLEVPDSFDELMQVIRGLPVFAVTFAILLMIWQEHHGLFKRFPSADGVTIWLNGALLFVVVSYIYPLKFLFAQIVLPGGVRVGPGGAFQGVGQLVTLMVIYGAGFATIFLIFATLYWRAGRRATDAATRHQAHVLVGHSFVFVGVAALSIALAVFGGARFGGFSGVSYGLIGPFQALYHRLSARYWKAPAVPASPAPIGTPASIDGQASVDGGAALDSQARRIDPGRSV